jgi:hypothetical protein
MNDITPLLSNGIHTVYDPFIEIDNIRENMISLLPGDAWKQKKSV